MQLTKNVFLVGSGEIGLSNEYDCHVYLVNGDNDALLIDAGVGIDSEKIKENVQKYVPWEKVSRVICTHSHADHSGGATFFQKEGKEVWLSEEEYNWMNDQRDEVEWALRLAKNAGGYPEDYVFTYFEPDHVMNETEMISCGALRLQPIYVRGHSPGMYCFLMKTDEGNVLFASDFVFIHGDIGLLNAPGSDLASYREDIKKLSGLHVDALFSGHRLFLLQNGQAHIQKAIEQLNKVIVPSTF
ncbi:MBL fold metallo-hydrolase [Siminovitchia sp. FSL H7-0308]|uniref:beta-lactamase n=1 Tax=Siminovitchia thermophila TaxID=1245522 RepID=A0ABS2RD15_9BACI|nr:MBL fold metallo-hydrolase [Siminovitchia thermophila]MBM7717275.1 glyoxylase-like metal-dependent hydrolase (beta-lactamase superfamily II) [Siminovitchia thermophila]